MTVEPQTDKDIVLGVLADVEWWWWWWWASGGPSEWRADSAIICTQDPESATAATALALARLRAHQVSVMEVLEIPTAYMQAADPCARRQLRFNMEEIRKQVGGYQSYLDLVSEALGSQRHGGVQGRGR
jgi:hypothetical protein